MHLSGIESKRRNLRGTDEWRDHSTQKQQIKKGKEKKFKTLKWSFVNFFFFS